MARDTSFYTEIKQKVELDDFLTKHLGVELVPDGPGRLAGLCPFHTEDSPSFKVEESDSGWKTWWCYGSCSTGGSVIDAVMQAEKFGEANEAAEFLNDLYDLGLDLNSEAYQAFKKTVAETREQTERTQRELADPENRVAKQAKAYLAHRGFSDETVEHFGLGVDTQATRAGRLAIPLIDKANHPVSIANRALFDSHKCRSCGEMVTAKEVAKRSFQARRAVEKGEPPVDWKACPHCGVTDKEAGISFLARQNPKYLFLSDFDKANLLYHQNHARPALMKDEASEGLFLVEGYADVWAGWQSGHRAICAYNGAVLSDWQARQAVELAVAAQKPVVLVPDFDVTGQHNVDQNIRKLRAVNDRVEIQVVHGLDALVPPCKDLGDVLQRHGVEKVTELLKESRWPAAEWQIRKVIEAANAKTGESFWSKQEQLERVAEILSLVRTREALDHVIPYLSVAWNIREEQVRQFFYAHLSSSETSSARHLFKTIEQAQEESAIFLSDSNVIPLGFEELDKCFPGGGVRPGQLMMMLGKAQPLDAKVLTPSGFKRMGDMQVGDDVVNPDGGVAQVLSVFPQGDRPIYRVTFSDGASTECDEEHLWQVSAPGSDQPTVRTLAQLDADGVTGTDRSHKRRYVPTPAPVEFSATPTLPVAPYLLGVLLGDGCLTPETPRLTSADPEIVDHIRPRLPAGVTARHTTDDGYEYRLASIGQFDATTDADSGRFNPDRNPLAKLLDELGLVGKRSEAKFVPAAYLLASVADRLELLRGLMDSNGTVSAQDPSITVADGSQHDATSCSCEFSSASRELADAVQHIVRSLGGTAKMASDPASYRTDAGERQECLPRHRVRVSLPPGLNPFKLEHKASRWTPTRMPRRSIADIQYVGVKPAQCIALGSENQLYVTDDFIVTHNSGTGKTMLASQILANMADNSVNCLFFSLEQGAGSFFPRLACQALDRSPEEVEELIKTNDPELEKVRDLYQSMLLIDNVPTETQDAVVMTPGKVRSIIQESNLTHFEGKPVNVVIIDHLGILEVSEDAPADVRKSETAAPGHIMKELFAVAKATNVFMIVLQQLPKQVPAGVPFSFDQGWGGQAQTAFCDYIIQIWRPEQAQEIDETERLEVEGQYKVALGKNRYGAGTLAHLYFDKSSLRILPPLKVVQPKVNPDGSIDIDNDDIIFGAADTSSEVGATVASLEAAIKNAPDPTPRDTKALLEAIGAVEDDGHPDDPFAGSFDDADDPFTIS